MILTRGGMGDQDGSFRASLQPVHLSEWLGRPGGERHQIVAMISFPVFTSSPASPMTWMAFFSRAFSTPSQS